ncbi:MAG TPA: PH domain-containing protein [Longimicrobiaceae bacterium]|nr:PH domain-containing protein [Longimicrobiaceae bacterium]
MPIDRGAIDAQLREIGEGERWWEQREFRELPYILHADELIRALVTGKLLGAKRPRLRAPRWLIVATDQRIICLRQERFARKQVEIPLGQVIRVQHSSGLRAYQITIWTALRRFRIRIRKDDAFRFGGALAPLMPALHPQREGTGVGSGPWLPGVATIAALPGVSDIVSRISSGGPQVDYATRAHVQGLEATVERLQEDVERLQQQVAFLENLLNTRADESFRARTAAIAP